MPSRDHVSPRALSSRTTLTPALGIFICVSQFDGFASHVFLSEIWTVHGTLITSEASCFGIPYFSPSCEASLAKYHNQ